MDESILLHTFEMIVSRLSNLETSIASMKEFHKQQDFGEQYYVDKNLYNTKFNYVLNHYSTKSILECTKVSLQDIKLPKLLCVSTKYSCFEFDEFAVCKWLKDIIMNNYQSWFKPEYIDKVKDCLDNYIYCEEDKEYKYIPMKEFGIDKIGYYEIEQYLCFKALHHKYPAICRYVNNDILINTTHIKDYTEVFAIVDEILTNIKLYKYNDSCLHNINEIHLEEITHNSLNTFLYISFNAYSSNIEELFLKDLSYEEKQKIVKDYDRLIFQNKKHSWCKDYIKVISLQELKNEVMKGELINL